MKQLAQNRPAAGNPKNHFMARRRRWRRRIVLLLAVAMVAGAVYTAVAFLQRSETLITERCSADAGQSHELATDQAANAALITAVAVQRGLPPRAASIALATAMQESKLRNISHGDQAGPDSRGLFQQRPSQGWGTAEQVMDPYHASNAFYNALMKVPDYQSLEITDAAQRVQRSAFPDAYARHEDMARAFASALTGQSAAGLDCTLRAPDAAGDPAALQAELAAAFGAVPVSVDGRTVVVEAGGAQAWAVAHWAVANAKALAITGVQTDGRSWSRAERSGWQASGAPAGRISITLAADPGR